MSEENKIKSLAKESLKSTFKRLKVKQVSELGIYRLRFEIMQDLYIKGYGKDYLFQDVFLAVNSAIVEQLVSEMILVASGEEDCKQCGI